MNSAEPVSLSPRGQRKRHQLKARNEWIAQQPLFKQAIRELMAQRAETLRAYQRIRDLEALIQTYRLAEEKRISHDAELEHRDQKEDQTAAEPVDAGPQ